MPTMFVDDTFPSFFRRPTFTPDGALLLLPTGVIRASPTAPPVPTTYAFARGNWAAPLAHFPGTEQSKPSAVVRASPVLYRLLQREALPATNGAFSLPYRMLFAVATLDTVTVYDTQTAAPLAGLACFHCEKITDMAW